MNWPRRSPRITPALSRMERCFDIDGLLIEKRAAISPADRSAAERYARILRLGTEARASKMPSIVHLLFSYLSKYLTHWQMSTRAVRAFPGGPDDSACAHIPIHSRSCIPYG